MLEKLVSVEFMNRAFRLISVLCSGDDLISALLSRKGVAKLKRFRGSGKGKSNMDGNCVGDGSAGGPSTLC